MKKHDELLERIEQLEIEIRDLRERVQQLEDHPSGCECTMCTG